MNNRIMSNISKGQITAREKEILRFLARDFTSKELAKQLYISIETVHTHRKNLSRKLGVKTGAGLIGKGYQLGIIDITKTN